MPIYDCSLTIGLTTHVRLCFQYHVALLFSFALKRTVGAKQRKEKKMFFFPTVYSMSEIISITVCDARASTETMHTAAAESFFHSVYAG